MSTLTNRNSSIQSPAIKVAEWTGNGTSMLLKYSLIAVLLSSPVVLSSDKIQPPVATSSDAVHTVKVHGRDDKVKEFKFDEKAYESWYLWAKIVNQLDNDDFPNRQKLVFCSPEGHTVALNQIVQGVDGVANSGKPIAIEYLDELTYLSIIWTWYCPNDTIREILNKALPGQKVQVVGNDSSDKPSSDQNIRVIREGSIGYVLKSWNKDEPDLKAYAKPSTDSIREAVWKKSRMMNSMNEWSIRFEYTNYIAVCHQDGKPGNELELGNEYVVVGNLDGLRLATICPGETYNQLAKRLYPFSHASLKVHQVDNMEDEIKPEHKLGQGVRIEDSPRILFVAKRGGRVIDFVYNFTLDNGSSKIKVNGVARYDQPDTIQPHLSAENLAGKIASQTLVFYPGSPTVMVPVCVDGKPLDAKDNVLDKNIDSEITTFVKVDFGGKSKVVWLCPQSTIGHAAQQIRKVNPFAGNRNIMFKKQDQDEYELPKGDELFTKFTVGKDGELQLPYKLADLSAVSRQAIVGNTLPVGSPLSTEGSTSGTRTQASQTTRFKTLKTNLWIVLKVVAGALVLGCVVVACLALFKVNWWNGIFVN